MDLAFKRIVEELPLAVAPQVVAIVKAGGPGLLQDVTEAVRGEGSRNLKACKAELLKLSNLAKKCGGVKGVISRFEADANNAEITEEINKGKTKNENIKRTI